MCGVGLLFQPQIARLAHLDLSLVGLTLLVAIVATVLAAFYPDLARRARAAGLAAEVELRQTMNMQIKPILAALRRHKAGTVLIALQIALTLAIVCNALFIIQQRLAQPVRAQWRGRGQRVRDPATSGPATCPTQQIDAQVRPTCSRCDSCPACSDASPPTAIR